MGRKRLVLVTDSANRSLIVQLTMNGIGERGGTWHAFDQGFLKYSKGTFQSYSDGISLGTYDPYVGCNVSVARLSDFWKANEIWANDSGKAVIYQGSTMNSDDKALWECR